MKRTLVIIILILMFNFTILSAAFLLRPSNITINLDDLASASQRNASLFVKGPWGKAKGNFGINREGWFAGPMSLAADSADNLYILDQENKQIQVFTSSGLLSATIPIDSFTYEDIAVDEGFIYLLDPVENHLVKKINKDGRVVKTYKISASIEPISGLLLENDQLYIEVAHERLYSIGTEAVAKSIKKQAGAAIEGQVQGDFKTEAELSDDGEVTAEFKGHYPLDSLKVSGSAETPAEIKAAFEVYSIISIDSDKEENLYIVLDIVKNKRQFDQAKDKLLGLVLRPNGSLVEKFYTSNNYYTSHFRKIAVSPKGTVFQLLTTPEGVEVYKW